MIHVPVSIGELIDKITILEIKVEKIKDKEKRTNCKKEYDLLEEIAKKSNLSFFKERANLKKVNEKLWDIEDKMRKAEASHKFGQEFIEITRHEYKCNDLRARIKKEINLKSGSEILEEKDYVSYT
ncbi:MAG: hypothetical protein ACD_7C00378G0002 [uncultured bacterium]|nr:MAG: hypothetical protein ACD_7C00378G0002 [uncultured bacterium]OGQ07210.1 MAG: hypothetical protein A3C45_08455 [Deltaproteobacteria bacterium RIFCSPHIGHO2_02_FULL_40_28]OGQ19601.1 MAG: hypothetical protein A3E27_07650 [Deltaproteobacteria bacterium RIFCSPHIGHO2_12_FULL_40_32]OGQ40878.1 MAG: hypothetical protein A3I69_03065 [Deltaproteobacteria bacterium RIFCSPLOWO2_02_FULL_40_36]OGQ53993.1 MAG: hypothetical protein A3G32_04345 [Deltaproteobacteria bacterium RIFCSPLOWO2_12_FULL_40_28]